MTSGSLVLPAQIASTIPGARFTVVRGAAHLANHEAPGEITAALQAHLAPLL
jgi:pimeloyl-ACP methyl ester carboxylesterase